MHHTHCDPLKEEVGRDVDVNPSTVLECLQCLGRDGCAVGERQRDVSAVQRECVAGMQQGRIIRHVLGHSPQHLAADGFIVEGHFHRMMGVPARVEGDGVVVERGEKRTIAYMQLV